MLPAIPADFCYSAPEATADKLRAAFLPGSISFLPLERK